MANILNYLKQRVKHGERAGHFGSPEIDSLELDILNDEGFTISKVTYSGIEKTEYKISSTPHLYTYFFKCKHCEGQNE